MDIIGAVRCPVILGRNNFDRPGESVRELCSAMLSSGQGRRYYVRPHESLRVVGVAATTLLDALRLDVIQFPAAMLHREGQHIDPVE